MNSKTKRRLEKLEDAVLGARVSLIERVLGAALASLDDRSLEQLQLSVNRQPDQRRPTPDEARAMERFEDEVEVAAVRIAGRSWSALAD